MMTPDSAARLATWHAQISDEIGEARKALSALEAEHATAIAAVHAAESAHRELQTMLNAAFQRLTSPLAQRLSWLCSELDEARGRVARARGALEAGRARVDELARAIAQLDHLLAEETEAAA